MMSGFELKQPTFEDLELLAEVSRLLKLVDLDHVLQQVIKLTADAVGAEKVSLFLHEGERIDWGHIFTSRNLSPDESIKVVSQVLDKGFAGWVTEHKRGDIIYDTESDDRWIIFPDDDLPVRSVICVPFLTDDQRVLAVITLTHSEPEHFQEYHLRLLTIVTNQATIAIRNAQLFHRIRSQQRQLETILQSMRDVLLVLDDAGRILLVNDAALPLLHLKSQTEAHKRQIAEFVDVDPAFEPIAEIVDSGQSRKHGWSFETRSERRQMDYQVQMAVWKDVLEGEAGHVVVMHDVTTLRDLHRFKDEMLRVASHDLRSPLALISGYADMIEMDTENDPTIHSYVEIIKQSTDRMGGLLEDLLRIERVRNSPLELHEPIDLAQLVKIVLVNLRPEAEAKKQRLESNLRLDGISRIVADKVLIRQSMENLISNAIKYTPEEGTITVKALYDSGKFYFVVSDTGIGISEEHQRHVFDSFYRVPQSVSQEKGSGLGLSLVHNVIDRHGGEVQVKSQVGQGSDFGFWLPLNDK